MNNEMLNEAIIYATDKHSGQVRKGTTKPYITHPLETMAILDYMQADNNLLIAGILHDTIEDTDATYEEIEREFGKDVAELVGKHSEDKSKTWDERKQNAIEELVTKVDTLITLHQRKLEKLKNIKKSLLEKMFV